MKHKLHKNDAFVTLDRVNHGYYTVRLNDQLGELQDKITCDTYRAALEYFAAFNRVAKRLGATK
jgi:hypothetical protein